MRADFLRNNAALSTPTGVARYHDGFTKNKNLEAGEFAMFKSNRRLSIENLEARQMMAGDVAAYVQNGNLYITEASGQSGLDNAIQISELPNGMIRVAGTTTTTDNTMTHVNKLNSQDFSVTGSLNVNLGGGSDLVVIGSEIGAPSPSFTQVNIDTSAPPVVLAPRSLALGGVQTPFNAPDNDDVIIWGIITHGDMNITTGAGNDWVYVGGANMLAGNLAINTGAGADTVQIENTVGILAGTVDIQTYSSLSETDADVVWLDSAYMYGNLNVRTGGGNDLFHMENATVYNNMNFDAGAGDDSATLLHVDVVKSLMAQLGDGNDSLSLDYIYGQGDLHFLGGGGTDSLTRTANVFDLSLEQTGWEYINGRLQIATSVGTVSSQRAV
jgi:hypothetical protein